MSLSHESKKLSVSTNERTKMVASKPITSLETDIYYLINFVVVYYGMLLLLLSELAIEWISTLLTGWYYTWLRASINKLYYFFQIYSLNIAFRDVTYNFIQLLSLKLSLSTTLVSVDHKIFRHWVILFIYLF